MAKKKRKNKKSLNRSKNNCNTNNKKTNNKEANGDSSTYGIENISEDDLQSLYLLDIQLKATMFVIYGQLLLCEANFQGRQVIFDKYNNESKNNNESNDSEDSQDSTSPISPVTPDKTVLQATYIFFTMKLIFIQIAFTRYDMVYNKKINGKFPYSLEPNEIINTANLLDLISCIYYIKAAEEILARDNNQPVFGIR